MRSMVWLLEVYATDTVVTMAGSDSSGAKKGHCNASRTG